jgi:hypothetical protein
LDSPDKEFDIVFDIDISTGWPIIWEEQTLLHVVLNSSYSIYTVSRPDIIYKHLNVRDVVLGSFKSNPVMELDTRVRLCICINTCNENMVLIVVNIEDREAINAL